MKTFKEDNTVSVLQKAVQYLKISVTKETVRESLKTHPNYPTFKSICDSLNNWKIDNYPLKFSKVEIKDISTPYIVHFDEDGGKLAFVTKIKNGIVYFYDSLNIKRSLLFKEFLSKCTGAVIILNPNEESGENNFKLNHQNAKLKSLLIPVVLGIIILYSLITLGRLFLDLNFIFKTPLNLLFLTKILGLVFSVILVFHEFDIHTIIGDKLCNINRRTNCNTVLNSNGAKIFGWFGWADLGLIYFLGGLLITLQHTIYGFGLLAITSAICLPYPIYSIYYQGFILKKWCPLCLAIQAILIAEFLILSHQLFEFNFDLTYLLNFIFTFLIIGIGYLLTNIYIREKEQNFVHHFKYLQFKNDPDVFKNYLLKSKYYNVTLTNNSLVFGPENAPILITAFLSLNCSHCARAFLKIKDILSNIKKIRIHFVLTVTDIELIDNLHILKNQNKEDEAMQYLENWYDKYPFSKHSITENNCMSIKYIKEITDENRRLFEDCNIEATPRFLVNGFLLPENYDVEDIARFSEIFDVLENSCNCKNKN